MITNLDFEASGLERDSYPIEVAWNIGNRVTSFLINPGTADGWTWWSREAENIHGISREFLLEHGSDVVDVATALREQLADCSVYTDAVQFDSFWCKRLFDATGESVSFEWRDFWGKINTYRPNYIHDSYSWECGDWRRRLKEDSLRNVMLPEHRADNDVRIRMEIYRLANLTNVQ